MHKIDLSHFRVTLAIAEENFPGHEQTLPSIWCRSFIEQGNIKKILLFYKTCNRQTVICLEVLVIMFHDNFCSI